MAWRLIACVTLPVLVVLAGCGDRPPNAGVDDDVVVTLGKRSAPWPDEVVRDTDDGLVEVLETDAVVREAWAALEPQELPTGGDPATSIEEGAHLAPEQLADRDDRVVMRVRHVESSTCPVRVADLAGDADALTLTLDDSGARECTDDAAPFTALIAVHADRLPSLDELPDEVVAGEHWNLGLRRASTIDDLAGTTDPAHDRDPSRGGFSIEPSTPAPGDELFVTFPPEDADDGRDGTPPEAPADHERGVMFALERRAGDAWVLETHLISDRDPDGPRTLEPVSEPGEFREPADLLIDDPDPDRLVLPEDVEPGLHRLCEGLDLDRCAHLDIES